MKGKWNGNYWFSGNVPDSLKERKTNFELTIDSYSESKISGKISDNVEMGGTAGIGSFSGTIKGDNIKFVKKMPVRTFVLPDGTTIEEEKPHRPIYYSGIIDSKNNSVQGTWRFKFGLGIRFVKGRILFSLRTKGEWEMKRT